MRFEAWFTSHFIVSRVLASLFWAGTLLSAGANDGWLIGWLGCVYGGSFDLHLKTAGFKPLLTWPNLARYLNIDETHCLTS